VPVLAALFLAATATCLCPDGIGATSGDTPILRAGSGARSLIVCGSLEGRQKDGRIRAAEFDVVRCDTRESLLRLGARQTALLRTRGAGLEVTEVVKLPAGRGGHLIDVPIRRSLVSPLPGGGFDVSTSVVLGRLSLDPSLVRSAVTDGEEAGKSGRVTDNLLARLATASLSGSREAEALFRQLPHGVPLEGDVGETYQELSALLDLARGR
jgi:hypothetical protein